jgi:hypothetical protein
VESSRYLVIKRDNRSIHTNRLVRRNRLLVDEGEAKSRGLYRLDKGCRRGFGIFGIRVEGDEVGCIHGGRDHRHHLLVPRHATCQYSSLERPCQTHLLGYMTRSAEIGPSLILPHGIVVGNRILVLVGVKEAQDQAVRALSLAWPSRRTYP